MKKWIRRAIALIVQPVIFGLGRATRRFP